MNAAKFRIGQHVTYKASDGEQEVGAILSVKTSKGSYRYSVLMLSGRTREFDESELAHN